MIEKTCNRNLKIIKLEIEECMEKEIDNQGYDPELINYLAWIHQILSEYFDEA